MPRPKTTPPGPDGSSTPRADAPAKADGTERYATDHYPGGLLVAGVKRAGLPSGRLRGLNLERARALPGVARVLTAADIAGSNRQGIVHQDQPVLVRSRVRHAGDALALVLAEDAATLRTALDLITADIEPLPGVFDPLEALKRDAPKVHEDHPTGNLLMRALIEKGDIRTGFAEAEVVLHGRFSTPMQAHGFLETENGLARRLPDGSIEMTVSTQAPFRDRFEIGRALGLDPLSIRIKAPYLGGAFGGKDGVTVQCLLALAALNADGRYVRMRWDREESMTAGYKRHAARLSFRLGARRDGALTALSCRVVFDSGAYAHLGGEIMVFGLEHAAGPYNIPHTRLEGRLAYTNNPVGGAFRGFGAVQTAFAMERMMDRLALRLGLDPLELRRNNALSPGRKNGAGVVLSGPAGVAECLDALSGHPLWKDRAAFTAAARPLTRRGVGVAAWHNAMGYGRGLPDAAAAKLELTETGAFRIHNSVPDMGQGNASAFVELAARALNQDPAAFEIVHTDTAECPPAGSSSASRTTFVFGNALLKACAAMREKLLSRAALALLKDELDGLELGPGLVREATTGREVPLARLAAFLCRDDRLAVSQYLMPVVADPPATCETAKLGFPHRYYAHAATLAAVEIDEPTGRVRPLAVVTAVEGGRVMNRQCVEQQIQGAAAQGVGLALYEDFRLKDGLVACPDFSTYLLPTSLDLPEFPVLTVDSFEPDGPEGLKGLGEVGIHGPAPALAAAVRAATGHDAASLPIRAEDVLWAMTRKKTGTPS